MKRIISILAVFCCLSCYDPPPRIICDYETGELKNLYWSIMVDSTELHGQMPFTFPYLWLDTDSLIDHLNTFLGDDGLASYTLDPESEGIILRVDSTPFVFNNITLTTNPETGIPNRVFEFTQTCE